MSPELVKRYSAPVPRYTSYPTAPHFSSEVGPETYRAWLGGVSPGPAPPPSLPRPSRACLGGLSPGTRLSLYTHIPFCDSLCWYCGCCTKAVRRYEPVAEYLA